MEEGEIDEFAKPTTAAVAAAPVEVDLKTTGIIVSSLFEAGNVKTPVEKNAILHMDYGDLSPVDRAERREVESVWTVGKKNVHQYYLPQLENSGRYIMVGTTSVACYALELCNDEIGKEHKQMLSEMECESMSRNLKHGIRHLNFRSQAVDTLTNLTAISKNDVSLRPSIKAVGKQLSKQIHTLPETLTVGKPMPPVFLAPRPGGDFPAIECLLLTYVAEGDVKRDPAMAKLFDTYYMWSIPTGKPSGKWAKTKASFNVRTKTIPSTAVNKTHFVILYQPHDLENDEILCIDVHELTDIGRLKFKNADRFYFCFPEQFSGQGILSMTLSEQNICSIAYSVGCVVIDILRQVEKPRAFVLSTPLPKNRRVVTTARVHHLPAPEGTRPQVSDDWDDNIANGTTPLLKNAPTVPAWCGTLVIGTTAGEAFGLCWRSGALVFVEIIPSVEPIFSCLYSNRRIIMHSVMALSGKLLPYISEQFTYLPTSRPLGVAICGTLVFVMEKYGSIQVYSCSARSVLFPFKPPKQPFKNDDVQYAYQAIDASVSTRVVALYPNGLVRVMEIRKKERGVPNNKPKQKKKK